MIHDRSHLTRSSTRTAGIFLFLVLCICAFFILVETGQAAISPPSGTLPLDQQSVTSLDQPSGTLPLYQPSGTSPDQLGSPLQDQLSGTSLDPPSGTSLDPPSGTSLDQPSSPLLDQPGAYPAPEISVSDITISEGDNGIVQAIFSIIRSGYLGSISTIDFATNDGSAVQWEDFASKSGTLVFDPNVGSLTVTVDVNGDTLSEADENFTLDLSDPLFAEIIDDQAICTITNEISCQHYDRTCSPGGRRQRHSGITSHCTWRSPAADGQRGLPDRRRTAAQPADYQSASELSLIPGDTSKPSWSASLRH
jgi:hypothetical protein